MCEGTWDALIFALPLPSSMSSVAISCHPEQPLGMNNAQLGSSSSRQISRTLGREVPLYSSEGSVPAKITTKPHNERFGKLNKTTKMTHNLYYPNTTVILKNSLPRSPFLPPSLPSLLLSVLKIIQNIMFLKLPSISWQPLWTFCIFPSSLFQPCFPAWDYTEYTFLLLYIFFLWS